MTTIFITDDHPIVLEGLTNVLNAQQDLRVIGIYTSAEEILKALAQEVPDVLLLDINLPDKNGIELCSEIRKKYEDIKIIALSVNNEAAIINSMLQQGANGYIQKNAFSEVIIEAIHEVSKGKTYLCEKSGEAIKMNKLINNLNFVPKITRREKEILQLASEGFTTTQIAEKLFISSYTVESHRKNLMDKFEVKSIAAAIKLAGKYGLL